MLVHDLVVEAYAGLQAVGGVTAAPVDVGQRFAEAGGVAVDQCLAQLGLAWEMVVKSGFCHSDLGSHVGVAEGFVAAELHQALGDVDRALCGAGSCRPGWRGIRSQSRIGRLERAELGGRLTY
jgi:hypothetical protein